MAAPSRRAAKKRAYPWSPWTRPWAAVPDGEPFACSIDIEGFESDLFQTNTDWIDRFALLIVEPHDWRAPGAGTSAAFQREMGMRGHDLFLKDGAIHYLRR